jgi:hypothetical protein
MFAGGRLRTRPPGLADQWSLSLWFWNGMPSDARKVSGWLVSRGHDHGLAAGSLHAGVGGKGEHAGRLILQRGPGELSLQAGKSVIPRWEWQHLAVVRSETSLSVFLNGVEELRQPTVPKTGIHLPQLFFGGRSDNQDNWEGRLDEIAIFDRALTEEEVQSLAGKK